MAFESRDRFSPRVKRRKQDIVLVDSRQFGEVKYGDHLFDGGAPMPNQVDLQSITALMNLQNRLHDFSRPAELLE